MLTSYKLLRGTTVNSKTNFVRVNHNFKVARQINYKTSLLKDLGITTVRFKRRSESFRRSFYGPIRPR
jgi:hypothetical protein